MDSNSSEKNSSSRVLRKLETAWDEKNYYEAHQIYRTLYFRLTSQRKYDDILRLLFDGTLKLLDVKENTSGADLAQLFVEVLQKSHRPLNDETTLNRIEKIFAKLVHLNNEGETNISGSENSVASQNLFVANVLKWSTQMAPEHKSGHPTLHKRFATVLWHDKFYAQARYHFMLSNDGENCASFLIEYHTRRGFANEVDLFLAQAVLQYLCRKNKATADALFLQYTLHHPQVVSSKKGDPGPPFLLPLLNFIWLLLLCIDTGQVTYFSVLIERYQPSIKRDPSYTEYLDKIGQIFFGLPPPRGSKQASGGASFLQNLMKEMMGSNEDDSGNEEETYQSVPTTPTAAAGESSEAKKKEKKVQSEVELD